MEKGVFVGTIMRRLAILLLPFVVCLFCIGCTNQDFFQAEIDVYQIGWGGGYYLRVDESKISVFDNAIEFNKLIEVDIDKEEAQEIKAALHRIPFLELEPKYENENIDDGGGVAISVRLDSHAWPSVLRMNNCRFEEVGDFVQIVYKILAESGDDEDVLGYLSWAGGEIFPLCK